jgi:intergrase/recombinase
LAEDNPLAKALLAKRRDLRTDLHRLERTITRYAIRHGLLAPKYMRKASWRLMIRVMPREVARFIQSKFGELKISEAEYKDLLSEADEHYPKCLVTCEIHYVCVNAKRAFTQHYIDVANDAILGLR